MSTGRDSVHQSERVPLYQRAVHKMKQVTRPILDYTSKRKTDLERAKQLERSASMKQVEQLAERETKATVVREIQG